MHFSTSTNLCICLEEREMEQGLVSLNIPTAINSISTVNSVSTNDSTTEQQSTDDRVSSVLVVVPSDDVMDLLRAIEMSRLQSVRDNEQNIYRSNTNQNSNHSSILSTNDKMDYFNDLQQAIELSLKIKNEQQLIQEIPGLLFENISNFFYLVIVADVESKEDDSQTINAVAVAATMPSLDLFSMYIQ
jgi:hypothetical protein